MSTVAACPAPPPSLETSRESPEAPRLLRGRAMTRCECAGVSFAEIAERVTREGLDLDEVARRTGCGATCTACIPDLRRYLARR